MLGLFLLSIPFGALADEKTVERPDFWERRLEKLRAVPYVGLSETVAEKDQSGVVLYRRDQASDGYNLYCSSSAPEALLLDMEGNVVHRWSFTTRRTERNWHHVELMENGDLVVLADYKRISRRDWDSNLLWKKDINVHHDVSLTPGGTMYVISRDVHNHRGFRIYFTTLYHLTDQGEIIEVWSSYENLSEIKAVLDTRSFIDSIIDSLESGTVPDGRIARNIDEIRRRSREKTTTLDHFHMNTVNLLPETPLGIVDARFQTGNLLVCFRNVNQIAVLERETYRPLWAWGEGHLEWPHHPTMLSNGNILIFDNGVDRKSSRIIELDVLEEEIVWEYKSNSPDSFYTSGGGSAQRLPNGNTLICETDDGRVFEVNQQGEIVWVWLNPATRKGRRETVYRMIRVPKEQVDWLMKRQWWWE